MSRPQRQRRASTRYSDYEDPDAVLQEAARGGSKRRREDEDEDAPSPQPKATLAGPYTGHEDSQGTPVAKKPRAAAPIPPQMQMQMQMPVQMAMPMQLPPQMMHQQHLMRQMVGAHPSYVMQYQQPPLPVQPDQPQADEYQQHMQAAPEQVEHHAHAHAHPHAQAEHHAQPEHPVEHTHVQHEAAHVQHDAAQMYTDMHDDNPFANIGDATAQPEVTEQPAVAPQTDLPAAEVPATTDTA